MKHLQKLFLLTFFVFISIYQMNTVTQADETTPVKILFIGNSSTYYNNMPSMVEGLAKADNIDCQIRSITASNYKLTQFATSGNSYNTEIMNALSMDKWDFVVLQEHREPIMQNLEKTQTALTTLKKAIEDSGARTVLYETQADCIGRDFTINGSSIYFDHNTLQYYMNKNYYYLSGVLDCSLAPAGLYYTRCLNIYPEISLYNTDMIHPSVEGSYLAACVLYQTIFNKSAYNNQYLPESDYDSNKVITSLENETAVKLQYIADAALNLTDYSIELKKGESASIHANLKYNEENPVMAASTDTITYSSLNDDKVGINRKTGTITGISTGTSMVMASTESGLMALCTVNVIQPSIGFTITEGTLSLHRKDTHTYNMILSPEDTTDKISWTSSMPSIVSVDENGTITAKKVGVATITATTDSGIKLTRSVRVKLVTPTNIKIKKTGGKTKGKKYANVKITWKKNTNAVKYYVYRRMVGKSSYTHIATTTAAKYTDKNKKKGKKYYYKIKSIYSNTKCNSYRSNATKISVK